MGVKVRSAKVRTETSRVAYITLQIAGVLDTQNLRGVPGIAADTL